MLAENLQLVPSNETSKFEMRTFSEDVGLSNLLGSLETYINDIEFILIAKTNEIYVFVFLK